MSPPPAVSCAPSPKTADGIFMWDSREGPRQIALEELRATTEKLRAATDRDVEFMLQVRSYRQTCIAPSPNTAWNVDV